MLSRLKHNSGFRMYDVSRLFHLGDIVFGDINNINAF